MNEIVIAAGSGRRLGNINHWLQPLAYLAVVGLICGRTRQREAISDDAAMRLPTPRLLYQHKMSNPFGFHDRIA